MISRQYCSIDICISNETLNVVHRLDETKVFLAQRCFQSQRFLIVWRKIEKERHRQTERQTDRGGGEDQKERLMEGMGGGGEDGREGEIAGRGIGRLQKGREYGAI